MGKSQEADWRGRSVCHCLCYCSSCPVNDHACPHAHGKSYLHKVVYGHCLCALSDVNEGAVFDFLQVPPGGNDDGGRTPLHLHYSNHTHWNSFHHYDNISTVTAILKVMIMRVLIPGRFRVWSVATPPSPLAGVCGVSTSGCEIPAGLHGSSQHGTVQSEGNPGISLTRTQMGSPGMTT